MIPDDLPRLAESLERQRQRTRSGQIGRDAMLVDSLAPALPPARDPEMGERRRATAVEAHRRRPVVLAPQDGTERRCTRCGSTFRSPDIPADAAPGTRHLFGKALAVGPDTAIVHWSMCPRCQRKVRV